MPWYRDGHSVPVVYRGRDGWWVDWSFDEDQQCFTTWRNAMTFALTTLHPHPEDSSCASE